MEKIRLLIVDDQVLFLESLSTFLRNYAADIDVVGLAKNGSEALEKAAALHPDIVLMDVHMPVMDGVEATGRLLASQPGVRILILSTYDEDEYVRRALKLGAAGYLLKDISPTELIASIRALKGGRSRFRPRWWQSSCGASSARNPRRRARSQADWSGLKVLRGESGRFSPSSPEATTTCRSVRSSTWPSIPYATT